MAGSELGNCAGHRGGGCSDQHMVVRVLPCPAVMSWCTYYSSLSSSIHSSSPALPLLIVAPSPALPSGLNGRRAFPLLETPLSSLRLFLLVLLTLLVSSPVSASSAPSRGYAWTNVSWGQLRLVVSAAVTEFWPTMDAASGLTFLLLTKFALTTGPPVLSAVVWQNGSLEAQVRPTTTPWSWACCPATAGRRSPPPPGCWRRWTLPTTRRAAARHPGCAPVLAATSTSACARSDALRSSLTFVTAQDQPVPPPREQQQ